MVSRTIVGTEWFDIWISILARSIYKKCLILGCHTFSLTFVYPLRKGSDIRDKTSFDVYEKAIDDIKTHYSEGQYNMIFRPFIPIEIQSKYAKSQKNDKLVFVNENILHWTIDANGDIYNFMDHYNFNELKIGNIYNDDIEVIKASNLSVQRNILFRNLSNEKCAECNMVQDCQGGNYIDNYPDMNLRDRKCSANV